MKRPRLRSLVVPILLLVGFVVAIWARPLGHVLGIRSGAPIVLDSSTIAERCKYPEPAYALNPESVRLPTKQSDGPVFAYVRKTGMVADPLWQKALVLYADGLVLFRPHGNGDYPPSIRELRISEAETSSLLRGFADRIRALPTGIHAPPCSGYCYFQWFDEKGAIVAEAGSWIPSQPVEFVSLVHALGERCEKEGKELESPGVRFFPVNHRVPQPRPFRTSLRRAFDPAAVIPPILPDDRPVFVWVKHTHIAEGSSWPEAFVAYADRVVRFRPGGKGPNPPPVRSLEMGLEPSRDLFRILQGGLSELPDESLVPPKSDYTAIQWVGELGSIVAEYINQRGAAIFETGDGPEHMRTEMAWFDIARHVKRTSEMCVALGTELDATTDRYFPVEHPTK